MIDQSNPNSHNQRAAHSISRCVLCVALRQFRFVTTPRCVRIQSLLWRQHTYLTCDKRTAREYHAALDSSCSQARLCCPWRYTMHIHFAFVTSRDDRSMQCCHDVGGTLPEVGGIYVFDHNKSRQIIPPPARAGQ